MSKLFIIGLSIYCMIAAAVLANAGIAWGGPTWECTTTCDSDKYGTTCTTVCR